MNSSKFIVLAVAITRRAPPTKIYNVDFCVCFSLNKYYGIYLGLELGMVSCTFFSFEIQGLLIFFIGLMIYFFQRFAASYQK